MIVIMKTQKKQWENNIHISKDKQSPLIVYKQIGNAFQPFMKMYKITKLFSKNVRKKIHSNISEITQKSQKSTSKIYFFFEPRSNFGFWKIKQSDFQTTKNHSTNGY